MMDKSIYNLLDIKAEVLIAELLERRSDISIDDLAIHPNGKFNHSVGRDIRDIRREENQYGEEKTKVTVARPGLYDALPAGLFHTLGTNDNRNSSGSKNNILANIKRMKQEEQEARKYFAPFDQVINRYRILIEQEERQMLTGFPLESSHTLFDIIWGDFDFTMNNYQKTILFTLLPMAHHIIGNLEYTRVAFEMVIGFPLTINENYKSGTLSAITLNYLGTSILSEDFILGNTTEEREKIYNIEVGPVSVDHTLEFLPDGVSMKSLAILIEYFLPLEIETEINVTIVESEFILEEHTDYVTGTQRLGYSTQI